MQKLQCRGICSALDDFGAGPASIGYMRDLQLDAAKLDGSLIRDITINARGRKLLMGVLQLCRSIGVALTAEQVESADQLTALQAFPIDCVQGFLLGGPGKVGHYPVLPDLLKRAGQGAKLAGARITRQCELRALR